MWGEADLSYRQDVKAEGSADDIMCENKMTVYTCVSAECGQTWLGKLLVCSQEQEEEIK